MVKRRRALRGVRRATARLAIAAITVALAAAAPALAQMSPGPLSRAHADLDSNLECLKCHGAGERSLDDRCLACHKEIAALIEARRGLHGLEARSECSSCHPEHGGRDFELIVFREGKPQAFDHSRTGWPLQGKHAAADCRKCHRAEHQKGAVAALLKRRDPGRSWLGLERPCASCHEDVHRGSLGPTCETCHGFVAWKPAVGFDHAKTRFALSGKHATVPCAKCHLVPGRVERVGADGKPAPLYRPVPHESCSNCHADPHAGALGPNCASCHVTDDFHRVARGSFDHGKTRFPLRGKHAAADCAKCHDPKTAWGRKPAFATCGACHRDSHAGTATLAGAKVDCARCHDETAFRPSTFTAAMHDRSKYPLRGKHVTVKCEACHRKNPPGVAPGALGPAGVDLRPKHAACADCHRDAHGGLLASRADHGRCESCHVVDAFKPSTFGVAEHASTKLALEGRHATAKCEACHGPVRPGLPALPGPERLGAAKVAFAIDTACSTCHLDPHAGRFAAGGAAPVAGGCRACHTSAGWHPAAVDVAVHAQFDYPLEGGHRAVPCVACHAELRERPPKIRLLEAAGPVKPMTFAAKHDRCEACHESPHGEQFAARPDRGRCEACHDVERFRPAVRFDHDRDTKFELRGAHENVPCARCHAPTPGPDGKPRVVYRPTPTACRDCHGPKAAPGEGGRS